MSFDNTPEIKGLKTTSRARLGVCVCRSRASSTQTWFFHLGGGVGATVLQAIGLLSQGQILGEVASGGVGGAVLMIVIGLIKSAMAFKA